MSQSIFTKIIKGEIPCHKIYEDEFTLAFLDIHPKTEGHVLVIPKKQIEFVWELKDADYQALMSTVKLVGLRLKEVLSPSNVGVMVMGLEVPHAHVHVFPFKDAAEYYSRQDMNSEPDHDALELLAKKLAF